MELVLSKNTKEKLCERVSSLNRHKKANIVLTVKNEFYKEVSKELFIKFYELEIAIKEDVFNKNISVIAKKTIEGDIFIITKLVEEESVDIPSEYKNTSCFCDHCRTDRFRKNLYILFDKEKNKFFQVGKSCLQDFLGIDEGFESYLKSIEYFDSLIEYSQKTEEEYFGDDDFRGFIGGYGKYSIETRVFLAACYEVMKQRKMTYISRADMENICYDEAIYRKVAYAFGTNDNRKFKTTKEEACIFISKYRDNNKFFSETFSKEGLELADKVIEYMKKNEFNNEIMQNAQTIIKSEQGYCPTKWLGLLAFLPNSYLKHQEYLKKKKEREENAIKYASEYLGKEKDKFKDLSVTLVSSHIFETYYGCSIILNMVDEKNHLIMWKTTAKDEFLDLEEGAKLKIKGSIKELTEYNGNFETVVTRCKMEIL